MRSCVAGAIYSRIIFFGNSAYKLFTWRNQIGFDAPISRWSATRKITHAEKMSAIAMRGAHGDHALGVPRIGNADTAIAFFGDSTRGQEVEITVVACGGHYDDARADEPVCFFTNGRASAGIVGHVVPDGETQVDALNHHQVL